MTGNRSTTEEVYSRLRELMARGSLAPGSRLVEADLARRLSVSRTPVRAALTRLLQEGYVEAVGNGRRSRLAVTPLTKSDSRELYWLVGEIEGLAARWAAELPVSRRKELVAFLRGINDAFRAASEPDRLFELDAAFHRTYVEAGFWPRLQRLHDALKPHTERYWRLYTSALVDRIDTSVKEHEEILSALAEGNAEEAARSVQRNWRNGAQRLAAVIDSLGERGSW